MNSKSFLKYCIQFLIVLIVTVFIGFTGCSKENGDAKLSQNQTKQTAEKKDAKDTEIIRDKNVNIISLDQDKDGSLYQCEMDYDVISDNPGTCPKCGMQLKKVSVADAKKNLDAFNGNE